MVTAITAASGEPVVHSVAGGGHCRAIHAQQGGYAALKACRTVRDMPTTSAAPTSHRTDKCCQRPTPPVRSYRVVPMCPACCRIQRTTEPVLQAFCRCCPPSRPGKSHKSHPPASCGPEGLGEGKLSRDVQPPDATNLGAPRNSISQHEPGAHNLR